MNDISALSKKINTSTLHFALLSLVTGGVWPLMWLYKKQDIISETTGYPFSSKTFIIALAVCFGLSHQISSVISPDVYDDASFSNILLSIGGLLSVASGVMMIVWSFRARTALRHYALNTFQFDLKMNAFYTVLFNVFYITYCINDMQQAQAKHQIIHGARAAAPSAPLQAAPPVPSQEQTAQDSTSNT